MKEERRSSVIRLLAGFGQAGPYGSGLGGCALRTGSASLQQRALEG
jgi:hypothetical protein